MVLKRIGWILLIFLFTNIFFTDKEMRRLCLWLVFFVMLGIQSAFAQFVVKGTVVSKADNEPLIGVSIMQKGTTNGVVTDIDGNYELKIQGGDADLVFSYIGMRSQEFRVNARTGVLNVALEMDSELFSKLTTRISTDCPPSAAAESGAVASAVSSFTISSSRDSSVSGPEPRNFPTLF